MTDSNKNTTPTTTRMRSDWESTLGRPQPQCDACESHFDHGDEFVSVLQFGAEGLARQEICPPCFEKTEHQAFAFWRSRVPEPEVQKKRPLDIEFLTEFFRRLHSNQEADGQVEVAYIVTLLLCRKKTLVQEGMETTDSGEFLVVRFKKEKEGPKYKVRVPLINAEKMEVIRDDLGRIFNLDGAGDGIADDKRNEAEGIIELADEN